LHTIHSDGWTILTSTSPSGTGATGLACLTSRWNLQLSLVCSQTSTYRLPPRHWRHQDGQQTPYSLVGQVDFPVNNVQDLCLVLLGFPNVGGGAIADADNTPGTIMNSRVNMGGFLVCGHSNALWIS
jgi:hypothetical protein